MSLGEVSARRARLAEAEQELAQLEGQYDRLTSRFKFDEAARLRPLIEIAQRRRDALAAGLPREAEPAPTPYAVVTRRPPRGRR